MKRIYSTAMKRLIFLTQCLLLCFLLNAQDTETNPEWQTSGDFVFAAYVGLTTSTISASEFGDNDSNSGNSFLLGLQADYFFRNNWSLKSKFHYEKRDFGRGSSAYLNATLAPVWHFGKNRRWHLHLGASYSAFLHNSLSNGSFETDFGIGVIIPIQSLRFFIELDGVTDNNVAEINFIDVNGNPIGSTKLRTNRSSINFGFIF